MTTTMCSGNGLASCVDDAGQRSPRAAGVAPAQVRSFRQHLLLTPPLRRCPPAGVAPETPGLPNRRVEILLWAYMVKPSLSQNSLQLALVTRFPNQLCEISWMMTSAKERSPASRQGVTKVRQGFSMPPNGKDGGMKSTSYLGEAGGHEALLPGRASSLPAWRWGHWMGSEGPGAGAETTPGSSTPAASPGPFPGSALQNLSPVLLPSSTELTGGRGRSSKESTV